MPVPPTVELPREQQRHDECQEQYTPGRDGRNLPLEEAELVATVTVLVIPVVAFLAFLQDAVPADRTERYSN